MGSTAAPAVVRRALAPNPEAPGGTKQWANSSRHEWAARAQPTAPEAGALPNPTAWIQHREWRRHWLIAQLPRRFNSSSCPFNVNKSYRKPKPNSPKVTRYKTPVRILP